MKRMKWLRLVAVIGVFALAVAACGGDGDGTGAASPTDAETSPTEAEPTEAASPTAAAGGDGTLQMGTLVPQTGDLAALGPPQQLAYELAVEQINEAGGVLGQDVELAPGDSGTNEQVAGNAVDQHLRNNVDAILGAASSRISLSVIDTITGAQTVQCSPSNTSASFTGYEDSAPGFYFRTAPADKFQAPALAETMIGDGFSQIGIIALNDAYGQGFADTLATSLEEQGASVVANVPYDPGGQDFSADVQELTDANPGAVALIGFPDTGAQILREMISQGIGPQDIGVYGADGMQDDTLPGSVNPDNPQVMGSFKGTVPSSGGSEDFSQAFQEFTPEGTQEVFSAHAYDCANIVALAAASAESDDPTVFHEEMVPVTRDGEQCNDFADCMSLLEEGSDIDYEGATGVDFVDIGEPDSGTYDVWELVIENGEGTINTVGTISRGETDEGGGGGSPSPTG